MIERPKVVVIAGPTASGKSSLAVELSLALNGEIVNADSMQVYRGMDVGTAKPTPEERKGVSHHLLDVVDPDEEFNAAIYRSMALPLITDIVSRGKICFVVGGTGLYIRSLLGGLFVCPSPDQKFRESLRSECEFLGPVRLYERLKRLDPEYASKIHQNDRVRIMRAIEIIYLTNRRPSDLSKQHGFAERPLRFLKLCLEVDREQLYDRINQRSVAMVDAGLAEEAERLLRKGYSPDLKTMKAIGYRHMIRYLKGEWPIAKAIRELQRDTRMYAKRQLTWFRAEPEVTWIDPNNVDVFVKKIKNFVLDAT
jgi:tRNA dimethylallyltransferase